MPYNPLDEAHPRAPAGNPNPFEHQLRLPRNVDIVYSGWAPDVALAVYSSESASADVKPFLAWSWDILEYSPSLAIPLLSVSDYSDTWAVKRVHVVPCKVYSVDMFFLIHHYSRTGTEALIYKSIFGDFGQLSTMQSRAMLDKLVLTANDLGVPPTHSFWSIYRECYSTICRSRQLGHP